MEKHTGRYQGVIKVEQGKPPVIGLWEASDRAPIYQPQHDLLDMLVRSVAVDTNMVLFGTETMPAALEDLPFEDAVAKGLPRTFLNLPRLSPTIREKTIGYLIERFGDRFAAYHTDQFNVLRFATVAYLYELSRTDPKAMEVMKDFSLTTPLFEDLYRAGLHTLQTFNYGEQGETDMIKILGEMESFHDRVSLNTVK